MIFLSDKPSNGLSKSKWWTLKTSIKATLNGCSRLYLYILRIHKTIIIEDKVMNEREGWGIMNKINYKKN